MPNCSSRKACPQAWQSPWRDRHRDLQSQGYRVSVSVAGRRDEVILQLRGDNAPPHTVENSQRNANTARTFLMPSGDWATNLAKDHNRGAQFLTGVIVVWGALRD